MPPASFPPLYPVRLLRSAASEQSGWKACRCRPSPWRCFRRCLLRPFPRDARVMSSTGSFLRTSRLLRASSPRRSPGCLSEWRGARSLANPAFLIIAIAPVVGLAVAVLTRRPAGHQSPRLPDLNAFVQRHGGTLATLIVIGVGIVTLDCLVLPQDRRPRLSQFDFPEQLLRSETGRITLFERVEQARDPDARRLLEPGKVVVTRFSDASCQGCKTTYFGYREVLASLRRRHEDVVVQVRDFPLDLSCKPRHQQRSFPSRPLSRGHNGAIGRCVWSAGRNG